MTEILHVHYDFVNHQNHISAISHILKWLGDRGFTIVHFSRPQSRNPNYPNLEFVAQRDKNFTEAELSAWNCINYHPFHDNSYEVRE